jgi:membrane associated rhomboid family serine protease
MILMTDPFRKRRNFLIGFAIGVAITAFSLWSSIRRGDSPIPDGLGPWVDLAAEAATLGVIIGVIAAWLGERGKKAR